MNLIHLDAHRAPTPEPIATITITISRSPSGQLISDTEYRLHEELPDPAQHICTWLAQTAQAALESPHG